LIGALVGASPSFSAAAGAVEDEADGLFRRVPVGEVAALLKPVQARVGKQFLCQGGLIGEADAVAAPPANQRGGWIEPRGAPFCVSP
jgi:hypothetical protein